MFALLRTYIWLKRFRYRRGYGVHSPFAFDFISNVVYEKGVYYGYRGLETSYGLRIHWMTRFFQMRKAYRQRCARLLFRISNYVHPDYILICGNTESWVDGYLAAGSVSADLLKLVSPVSAMNARFADKTLLVYLADVEFAERVSAYLSGFSTQGSIFLIAGIHADESSVALWHRFQANPEVGITFDLYDYGIVFWDQRRYKQHYLVNF